MKVTIAIPTYNRCLKLKKAIESVFVARKETTLDIELVISDNCSADDTDKYLGSLSGCNWVKVNRNSKNIGSALNFWHCLELSTGDYFWLLGDDDELGSDALRKVEEVLVKNSSVIFVNFYVRDALRQWRAVNLKNDLKTDDPEEVLKVFGLEMSLISSVILPREEALRIGVEKFRQYIDTYFAYLFLTFEVVKKARGCYIISTPILVNNVSYDVSDYKGAFLYGLGRVIKENTLFYDPCMVKAAFRAQLKKFIIPELCRRPRGGDREDIKKYVKTNFGFGLEYVAALMLDMSPHFVITAIRTLKRVLRC